MIAAVRVPIAEAHLYLLAAVFFFAACCLTTLLALEQEFTDRLRLSSFDFSLVFSAMIAVRLFLDYGMGRLSDQIGRKVLIVTGLLILGPSTLLLAYGQTTLQLVGIRMLMGVGMSNCWPKATISPLNDATSVLPRRSCRSCQVEA